MRSIFRKSRDIGLDPGVTQAGVTKNVTLCRKVGMREADAVREQERGMRCKWREASNPEFRVRTRFPGTLIASWELHSRNF